MSNYGEITMSGFCIDPIQDMKKRRVLTAFASVAALAVVGAGLALQERKPEEGMPEVAHLDPWSQCIKDAADEAMHNGLDFERLARSCSKLAQMEHHPA